MGQQPPRPLRVLVVEDYADAREALHLLLRLWGHACDSVCNGHDALDAAAALLPDVVLMDIGLPGLDEWKAAREMRKLPSLSETVFVAVTGYGYGADVARSYAEGFAAHLTKPHDPAELMDFLAGIAAERAGPQAGA
jgi:CheY-like chemotaxis protein